MRFERRLLESLIWILVSASLMGGVPWFFPERGQRFLRQMSFKNKVFKEESGYTDSFLVKKAHKQ